MNVDAQVSTTSRPASSSVESKWEPALPVVTNPARILRPKSAIPMFREDSWELAAMAPDRTRHHITVNFDLAPARFRTPLKQALWIAINEGLPDEAVQRLGGGAKRHLKATTLVVHFGRIAAFLRAVVAIQPEVRSLRGITETTASKAGEAGCSSANMTRNRMASVRLLHYLTQRLDVQHRLPEPPWLEEIGIRVPWGGENSTPILPEDIATPLLLWSTAFVNAFSEDILQADRRVNEWRPDKVKVPTSQEREDFLGNWGSRFGTKLPSTMHNGELAFAMKYACFRMNHPVVYEHGFARPISNWPGFTISADPHCPIGVPVKGTIHGQTWQPQGLDFYSIRTWCRHLQAAAMILLGLDAAMRPEELLNLEIDVVNEPGLTVPALERVEAPDGQVRYLLRGRTFKSRIEPDGVERSWALTESGAHAVRVLERLSGGRGRLFAARGRDNDSAQDFPVMTSGAANTSLRDFAAVTRSITRELRLPTEYMLPDDAEDFLTLKVLRRTSEAITQDMVGGVLAGAHQAGHTVRDPYDTKVTEGYGSRLSTTKTGWGRQTTDRVTALAHLAIEAQTATIGGPAAARATRIAEMAVSELHLVDAANLMTPLRSKEWRRITTSLNQDVYEVELSEGHVAFCIFDVTRSMCTEDGEQPDLAGCRITCQNKALTRDSVKGLELRRQQLVEDSRDPALTKEERIRASVLAEQYDNQITQSGLASEKT